MVINKNRFIEDDPDSLKFSSSEVTEAERKRAKELWEAQRG